MTIPLIKAEGCKNCKFAMATDTVNFECRWGPPTAVLMLGQDAHGTVGVRGTLSAFPLVGPDIICGRYERGIVAAAGQYKPNKIDA
jgi:hypothetical protein